MDLRRVLKACYEESCSRDKLPTILRKKRVADVLHWVRVKQGKKWDQAALLRRADALAAKPSK